MMDPLNFRIKPSGRGRKSHLFAILTVVALLFFASLACQLNLVGPPVPTDRVPPSPPPQSQNWRTILENAKPGDVVTLTLTENDLTSILVNQVQSAGGVTIRNPRAVLTNGQIEIYGQAETDSISGNFKAVLNASADNQGKLHLDVISANFGSIPVPSSLMDRLSASLNQAVSDDAGSLSTHFKADSVDITEGLMTIHGTVQ